MSRRSSDGEPGEPLYGLIGHQGSDNLGDDIQSLAAAAFLPRIDVVLPRESLDQDPGCGRTVRMIFNGWFMHDPRRWPAHRSIVPLPVSIHIARSAPSRLRRWRRTSEDLLLSPANAGWLSGFGPVGARDRATLELLRQRSIPAYHSGCLTLTLRRRDEVAKRDIVVACDLAPAQVDRLQARFGDRLVTATHSADPAWTQTERFRRVEALLDLYASARSVLTTRLHCALPCLALGTPVLFVDTGENPDRLEPARDLAHWCAAEALEASAPWFDPLDPPDNPDRHSELAASLAERCRAFVGKDDAAPRPS